MVQVIDDWFTLPDGMKLFTKTWKPDGQPVAVMVFLHGFSDHCSAYYNFFPTLASPTYSIEVCSFDQRGWGRSVHQPSDKGLTGPTSTVLSDIHAFITHVSTTNPKTPLFLMGHSMGGAEALHYTLTTSPAITNTRPSLAGLLLEAPYIALDPSSQPNSFTVMAGKLAAKFLPNHQMVQKLDATYMSKSATVRADWVNDTLCHDTGTLEGLAGMLQRAADLVALSSTTTTTTESLDLKRTLPCPLWLAHGDGDRVTSFPASRRLFDALMTTTTTTTTSGEGNGEDKNFRNFEGAYHKLHAEPDGVGDRFAREVGEWIVRHNTNTTDAAAGGDTGGLGGNGKPKL